MSNNLAYKSLMEIRRSMFTKALSHRPLDYISSKTIKSMTLANTNLAPINDGNWWTDSDWTNINMATGTETVFYDTTTTHNGAPTWRINAADSSTPNNFGADHGGISLKPGDQIIMSCWIKTSGVAAGAYTGARIGLDWYGANGRIGGAGSQQEAAAGISYPNAPQSLQQTEAANYVPWGSDWTFMQWTFTVPALITADGYGAYPINAQAAPTWCIPWTQIYGQNGFKNTFTSWFSDFQFYVNPSTSPTTYPLKIIPSTGGTTTPPPTVYPNNAVWIENENTTTNYANIIPTLVANGVKYAIIYVGGWNATTPSAPTINHAHTNAFYSAMCAAFYAAGITPIAWAEAGPSGYGSTGTADVTPANYNAYNAAVGACVALGFGGFSDDIEAYTGTIPQWIAYLNQQAKYLHSLGKLCMPAVPCNTGGGGDYNQHLNVDFILTMFYWTSSLFQDPNAAIYWQENFGTGAYNSTFGTPASPVILGIINNADAGYPLSWQLSQAANYIGTYGTNSKLTGIALFSWEKMTAVNASDWTDWMTWNSTSYNSGTVVTVTANPNTGNTVSDWILDGASTGVTALSIAITMNAAHTIQPVFAAQGTTATFGDTNIEANIDHIPSGVKQVCRFQATATGTITHLTLYCGINGGSPKVIGVVFADNNGAPGALLGQGNQITVPASPAWTTLTGLNVPGTNGAYYWLGFIVGQAYPDSVNYYFKTGATNQAAYNQNTNAWTSPDNPFGTPNYIPEQMSIYATVTATTPIISQIVNWDINPKSGNLPFTVTFVGYLSQKSQPDTDPKMNGETINIQFLAPGSSTWQNTGVTATTTTNGSYTGYFTGQLAMGNNMYPGPWQFKAHYAGNPNKNLLQLSVTVNLRGVNALIL